MRPSVLKLSLVAVPALTALALTVACGGSKSSDTPAPVAGATGGAAIILTDAPSDQWSAVEVVVTQVTLLNKADHTK